MRTSLTSSIVAVFGEDGVALIWASFTLRVYQPRLGL